jgi:hypothetical protein
VPSDSGAFPTLEIPARELTTLTTENSLELILDDTTSKEDRHYVCLFLHICGRPSLWLGPITFGGRAEAMVARKTPLPLARQTLPGQAHETVRKQN